MVTLVTYEYEIKQIIAATMMQRTQAKILEEAVKQLKLLRISQGISHETLARKAGVTRSAISHIESGKRKPSLLVALSIAEALGTELSEILSKVEKANP